MLMEALLRLCARENARLWSDKWSSQSGEQTKVEVRVLLRNQGLQRNEV